MLRRGSMRSLRFDSAAMIPLTSSYTVPFSRGAPTSRTVAVGQASCRELGHSAAAPYAPATGASTRPGSMYRHENW